VIVKTDEVVWYVNSECGKVDERVRLDNLQEQLGKDLSGVLIDSQHNNHCTS